MTELAAGEKDRDCIQVSIICATYNHEPYIREAIEGFLMQETNFPFEIIIHDDCSTDGTASVVAEYERKYPNIITAVLQDENQHSQGVCIQDTFVAPLVKGKYVALCEGDDFWIDPNKLQLQYEALERNPECSLCVHEVLGVNVEGCRNGNLFPAKKTKEGTIEVDELVYRIVGKGEYPFQTSSFFLKREHYFFVDEDSTPLLAPGMRRDESLLRELMGKGSFYFIDRAMSCYRQGVPGSWSSRARNDMAKVRNAEYMMKINAVFDEITKGAYSEQVVLGSERNHIVSLVSRGLIAEAYKTYRGKESYRSLPRHMRADMALGSRIPFLHRVYVVIKGPLARFAQCLRGMFRK